MMVAFTVKIAYGNEPLPVPVENAQNAIRANQPRLAELKELVAEFERLKENNAIQYGILQANNYDFDWDSLKAVPLQ